MEQADIDKKIAEIGEYTPGPWEIDRFKGQPPYLVTNRHDVICLFQHHERIRKENIEANARLIELAPELLSQLKACREESERFIEYHRNPPTSGEPYEVNHEQS